MATFKVTNIVKIENNSGKDIAFRPYGQNFVYVLGNGNILEIKSNKPEKSLFYYKSVLPEAIVELVDAFDRTSYPINVSNFEHGTITGAETIALMGTAQLTITPDSGYYIPNEITVTGAEYTYSDGVIELSNPTDDVFIFGACLPEEYSIDVTIYNGSYSGDTVIYTDGTASIEITPDSGYLVPQSITVDGASYEYVDGNVSLSNPTGTVSIEGTCEQEQQQLTQFYQTQQVTGIDFGDVVEGQTVAALNTVLSDYSGTDGVFLSFSDGSALMGGNNNGIAIIYYFDANSNPTFLYASEPDAGSGIESEGFQPAVVDGKYSFSTTLEVSNIGSDFVEEEWNGTLIGAITQ